MSMEEILIFTEQEKRSLLELTKTLERNLEKDFLNKSYGFIKEKIKGMSPEIFSFCLFIIM